MDAKSKTAPTPSVLMEKLSTIVDPDLGIGIVDLGLVYDIRVADGRAEIDMTFTSMGCPAGAYLYDEVKRTLERTDGIETVEMNIVWDPPWSPDRVNPEVRFALGIY